MKLSIIIPVKDQSEALLNNLKQKVLPFFDSKKGLTYDVIVVPNGSSDEQRRLLEEGFESLPANCHLLEFDPIGAKGRAVRRGLLASNCDYDLVFDADLATDLRAFDAIYPRIGDYDAFLGNRDDRRSITNKRPLLRKLGHFVSKSMVKVRFGMKGVGDTQCGFKCFRDPVAKAMANRQMIDGIAYDVEHCYFLCLNKFRLISIPVIWLNDEKGTSIPFAKSSKEFSKDLGRIKKNRKNYTLTKQEKESIDADR